VSLLESFSASDEVTRAAAQALPFLAARGLRPSIGDSLDFSFRAVGESDGATVGRLVQTLDLLSSPAALEGVLVSLITLLTPGPRPSQTPPTGSDVLQLSTNHHCPTITGGAQPCAVVPAEAWVPIIPRLLYLLRAPLPVCSLAAQVLGLFGVAQGWCYPPTHA